MRVCIYCFFLKIKLYTNNPTGAPEVCMVRTATAINVGCLLRESKNPFLCFQLVDFALLYGFHSQGFCHIALATITIL